MLGDYFDSESGGVSGSNLASYVALAPYPKSSPQKRYAYATGTDFDEFTGNDRTKYGEYYEERGRLITSAVFGAEIRTYGFFQCQCRRFLGVSLDGLMDPVDIYASEPHPLGVTRPKLIHSGPLVWENKCSPDTLKPCPEIPHILQIMCQMYVMQASAGILTAWCRDAVRLWFISFCPELWRWVLFRVDLMTQHIKRRVPVEPTNFFFPWLLNPPHSFGPNSSCADWLRFLWFNYKMSDTRVELAEPVHGPTLNQTDLQFELHSLGLVQGRAPPDTPDPNQYWCNAVSEDTDIASTATAQTDPALLYLPPKPRIYQIYTYTRAITPQDRLAVHTPACLEDQTDPNWFRANFPSVPARATALLNFPYDTLLRDSDGLPPLLPELRGAGDGDVKIEHLFITKIVQHTPPIVYTNVPFTPEETQQLALALQKRRARQLERNTAQVRSSSSKLPPSKRAKVVKNQREITQFFVTK
jgi:hypothetical protein